MSEEAPGNCTDKFCLRSKLNGQLIQLSTGQIQISDPAKIHIMIQTDPGTLKTAPCIG
ncbi:hypothetical protein ACUBXI_003590 [Proteus mirabilis]